MGKQKLGRGLSAILADVEDAYKQDIEDSYAKVKEIDIFKIEPNPYQPRKNFDEVALQELANSIEKHGLIQPIIVVEKDDSYMLIAGERRLRASKLANLTTIKAIVTDYESKNLRELALIENIQREDLNPIELAKSYHELIQEYNITQEELSDIVHKSRTQITNTLRLLNLLDKTKNYLIEGKISQGHAKVLVGLDSDKERTIVDTIIGQKLSVRETEKLVKDVKQSSNPIKNITAKQTKSIKNIDKAVNILTSKGFKTKSKNDSLIIKFNNENDLEKFLSFLNI